MVEKEKNIVAIGSMGLDYSGKNIKNQQRQQRFTYRKQLVLAVRLNKTVVIHSREAGNDCFTIAKEELPTSAKIHVHCFMQGWTDLLLWIGRFPNVVVGVTPVCTYENTENVEEIVRCAPFHRLVLEMDAPYFLPTCAPLSLEFSDPQMALQVGQYIAKISACLAAADSEAQLLWESEPQIFPGL